MRISINLSWRYFLFVFALGGFFITLVLVLGYYEKLIDFVVASQTRIIAGTPSYDQWQKIPIPVYLRIRFFNITNPEGFAKGEKAKLNEMGPYTYKETLEKFDVTFDKEADTVRYRQVRYYYFQPLLSSGGESDRITMINIPFVGAAKIINDYTNAKFILSTFESMLADRGERLTSTHSVREILFDGFSVENILELANSPIVKDAHKIKILKPITKFKVPSRLLNGKMGFLEGRNGSDEGWMTVRTGIQTSDDFGRIVAWKDQTLLKVWRGKECNTPRGTDGIIYQPFLTEETKLEAFVPDVCRSLWFTKHETVKHGLITTYRFRQPEEMYETIDVNPDNYCYCPYKEIAKCPPKGLLSIATCFEGAPVMMSQPHFLGADPSVLEGVEGLNPDPEKHWGYLDLHPKTGLSVEVRQKVQFAIEVNRWPTMPTFAKVTPAYVPMLWLEEGGDLEGLNLFLLVFLDSSMAFWAVGKWGLVGFFGALTILALVLIKNKKPTPKRGEKGTPSPPPPGPPPEKVKENSNHRQDENRDRLPPAVSKAPPPAPEPQYQRHGHREHQNGHEHHKNGQGHHNGHRQKRHERRRSPSPHSVYSDSDSGRSRRSRGHSGSSKSYEYEYERY